MLLRGFKDIAESIKDRFIDAMLAQSILPIWNRTIDVLVSFSDRYLIGDTVDTTMRGLNEHPHVKFGVGTAATRVGDLIVSRDRVDGTRALEVSPPTIGFKLKIRVHLEER